jgi:hypothetical protein
MGGVTRDLAGDQAQIAVDVDHLMRRIGGDPSRNLSAAA